MMKTFKARFLNGKRERKEPATLNINSYLLTAMEEHIGQRTTMLPKQDSNVQNKRRNKLWKEQTADIDYTYDKEERGRDSYLPILLAAWENKLVGSPCVFAFDDPKKTFLFYR
jgi:hypothetical protein